MESSQSTIRAEILVLPFVGQGHLFPSMELCKRLSSYHNFKSLLIVPSNLSSSVPSVVRRHPFLEVVDIPNPSPPPLPEGTGSGSGHQKLGEGIESFLTERYNKGNGVTRPACVVIDVMMSWSKDIFVKSGLPVVSFFTSGACSSAIDYAGWVANVNELKPGQTRLLDGLPTNMAITSFSEFKLRYRHRSPGMPTPGRPEGFEMDELECSVALLFNTCVDIDGPFISYLSRVIDKPVYGIGPLLPEHYSNSVILHDAQVRSNKRVSNYTEDQVLEWLDSKPSQSVIYVSFGSEVGPTIKEYDELSNALEESDRCFIWANSGLSGYPPGSIFLEPKEEGYYPIGLDKKVGERGLIIKGWAPQLLILSHGSIGGLLSHCGWNSTVEAIGKGVPILAWPIRGDQFHNAKFVVNYLKVGHHLLKNNGDDEVVMVKKSDIINGIDLLMDDKEAHMNAVALRSIFMNGFPASSVASLKSFLDALGV